MTDIARYDYAALEAEAKKLKASHENDTAVIISAENHVPMQVLVQTMDALRGTECRLVPYLDALASDDGAEQPEGCYFFHPIVEAGAG